MHLRIVGRGSGTRAQPVITNGPLLGPVDGSGHARCPERLGTGRPLSARGSRIRARRWLHSLLWRAAVVIRRKSRPQRVHARVSRCSDVQKPSYSNDRRAFCGCLCAYRRRAARATPAHRKRKHPRFLLALFRGLNGEFAFHRFINLTVSVEFFARNVNPLNLKILLKNSYPIRATEIPIPVGLYS